LLKRLALNISILITLPVLNNNYPSTPFMPVGWNTKNIEDGFHSSLTFHCSKKKCCKKYKKPGKKRCKKCPDKN